MSHAQSIQNHTVDTQTGFIESNGYVHAFDAIKKIEFLERYKANGLALYRTCRELGMSCSTIHHHYKIDQVFKSKFDEVEKEYIDELEATSKISALNPKMVIERIFQLKSLRPDKYGDVKTSGNVNITINVDGNLLDQAKKREEILDAEIVENKDISHETSQKSP